MNAGRKEAESRRSHVAPPEREDGILPGISQTLGDTQITRNGLN